MGGRTRRTPALVPPGFAEVASQTTPSETTLPTIPHPSTTVDGVAAWLRETPRASRKAAWQRRDADRRLVRWLENGEVA